MARRVSQVPQTAQRPARLARTLAPGAWKWYLMAGVRLSSRRMMRKCSKRAGVSRGRCPRLEEGGVFAGGAALELGAALHRALRISATALPHDPATHTRKWPHAAASPPLRKPRPPAHHATRGSACEPSAAIATRIRNRVVELRALSYRAGDNGGAERGRAARVRQMRTGAARGRGRAALPLSCLRLGLRRGGAF
jgi:hypothetical protein